MYAYLLTIHNINRWLVLLSGIYAIVLAFSGIRRKSFSQTDNYSQAIFLGICQLQLTLGLILYFVSPLVTQAFKIGLGNAMKDAEMRFFTIEHALMMFIAVTMIQVGRSISKKQTDPVLKHKKALTFFVIGMLLMLSRIPWHRVLWPQ